MNTNFPQVTGHILTWLSYELLSPILMVEETTQKWIPTLPGVTGHCLTWLSYELSVFMCVCISGLGVVHRSDADRRNSDMPHQATAITQTGKLEVSQAWS